MSGIGNRSGWNDDFLYIIIIGIRQNARFWGVFGVFWSITDVKGSVLEDFQTFQC